MAYFSNGSEGEILERQCEDCILGDPDAEEGCPVMLVQMMFNYDQCSDGQEKLREAMSMLVNDKGTCQVKRCMDLAGEMQ